MNNFGYSINPEAAAAVRSVLWARKRAALGPTESCTLEELEGDLAIAMSTLRRIMHEPPVHEVEEFIRFAIFCNVT